MQATAQAHDSGTQASFTIWIQGLVLLTLFLILHGPSLPGLVRDWSQSTFSYGFLIPFLFGSLVWSRRSVLRMTPIRPSFWGLPLLAAAVTIRLAGQTIGDDFTSRMSMLIALTALVILVMGALQFRVLRYPLAYLFLMLPWPYAIVKPIIDVLRLSEAAIVAFALNAVGIHVTRQAYLLYLPNMMLEVADGCCGLASVFTLVAVAGMYAYFLSINRRLKGLLIAAAVPLALFCNLVRMIVTAILARFFGIAVFQSTLHMLSGTIAFLAAVALLIALGEVLRVKSQRLELPAPASPLEVPRPLTDWRLFLPAVALFLAGFYFASMLDAQSAVPLRTDLQGLAAGLGSYTASPSAGVPWKDSYADSESEATISRIYRDTRDAEGATPIELFIGYRGRQRGAERLRSPRMVFPSGWNYMGEVSSAVPVLEGTAINGRWLLSGSGKARRLIFYWYQTQGRSVSNELEYRLRLVQSSILAGRTDGAIVRIATPVSAHEPVEQSAERIRRFILEVYPKLGEILPAA